MRFSTSALLAIAAAPLLAFAQGQETSNGSNPFNIPPESLNTEAGESVNLTWKPTTQGTVTIYLRSGASNALNKGTAIASNIDNSGSFNWNVPEDIVRGSNYALEIVDDADDANTNYTPPFVIESTNNAAPSASSSDSSSSASASSSSDSSATASSTETESSTATETESSATSTDSSSTTAAAASSSATHHSNSTSSLTTSTSSRSSSSATSTSDSDVNQVAASEGGAARTSAFVGLLGLVALGAFAL